MRSARSSRGSSRSRPWSRRTCTRRSRSPVRDGTRRELAERLHELGAPAVIVTGGHGDAAGRPPVRRRAPRRDRRSSATRSVRRTAPAARTRPRSRRCSPAASPLEEAARGAAARRGRRRAARPRGDRRGRRAGRRLQPERSEHERRPTGRERHSRDLRERRPLVHQITNYVVMNETANATLALGALPVMAHAREEVEEMVGLAGALVLNIGTLSPHWVEAMLLAGRAANEHGVPVVLDPVGVGRDALPHRDREADPRRGRRRGAARQRRRGRDARRASRRRCAASSRSAAGGDPAELARDRRAVARRRRVGHRPGRPRLRRRADRRDRERPSAARVDHRHRLHVERGHRLLPRGRAGRRSTPRSRRSSRSAWRARTRRGTRRGRARSTSRSTTRSRRSIRRRSTTGREAREGARDRRRPRDGAPRGRWPARRSCSCA